MLIAVSGGVCPGDWASDRVSRASGTPSGINALKTLPQSRVSVHDRLYELAACAPSHRCCGRGSRRRPRYLHRRGSSWLRRCGATAPENRPSKKSKTPSSRPYCGTRAHPNSRVTLVLRLRSSVIVPSTVESMLAVSNRIRTTEHFTQSNPPTPASAAVSGDGPFFLLLPPVPVLLSSSEVSSGVSSASNPPTPASAAVSGDGPLPLFTSPAPISLGGFSAVAGSLSDIFAPFFLAKYPWTTLRRRTYTDLRAQASAHPDGQINQHMGTARDALSMCGLGSSLHTPAARRATTSNEPRSSACTTRSEPDITPSMRPT
jgi:hypothetical protein